MISVRDKKLGFKEVLVNHKLKCLHDSDYIKVFRMYASEDSIIDTIDLIFRKGQIIISGDLCPGDNRGVISNNGYGLDWFTSKLSDSYLCEKFLSKEWIPELAVEEAREQVEAYIEEQKECGRSEKWWELTNEYIEEFWWLINDDNGPCSPSEDALYRVLSEIDSSIVDDVMPGYDYNFRDRELLVEIQQKFAQLYNEQH